MGHGNEWPTEPSEARQTAVGSPQGSKAHQHPEGTENDPRKGALQAPRRFQTAPPCLQVSSFQRFRISAFEEVHSSAPGFNPHLSHPSVFPWMLSAIEACRTKCLASALIPSNLPFVNSFTHPVRSRRRRGLRLEGRTRTHRAPAAWNRAAAHLHALHHACAETVSFKGCRVASSPSPPPLFSKSPPATLCVALRAGPLLKVSFILKSTPLEPQAVNYRLLTLSCAAGQSK